MADEAKRPLKVFLCHASGDKPLVRELYRRLVAEGVDAWLDKEKLLPGQDWQLEIPKVVRESDVVVVCLSKKSITKEGYVQKELKFALDFASEKPEGTIFLIPARLEECDVPSQLGLWHWVDLFESDGYEWLMRSLRLRADKLGLRIGDTIYTDEESEQRLEQLYTEGLAAFYTEDWDRAYQRFQTILREHPTHKNAAEKLTQAEQHRDFVKLYGQAMEAYKAENWLVAIEALEDLLEKSGDYKDAIQLLKDAKKQRQLRELYAEAKRLHTAQKWHAVLRVFEQIAGVDSAYSDPEGLFASAQKETAELKRLADLNDLYRQGVHKMDAGEWYEARALLEQVHKSQTGFHDTERLLRKIEDEILRIEEGHKRNAQVQMLYEQARKMTRAGQWGKALMQVEEIQKLDNQFVDRDGIAEKAKAELGREEQEAQRRRELAALYAEAVSLLEAKKYQEALEQWNAIQAIDPKYRDTTRVKATARRKLDELSRPEVSGRPWPKIVSDWFSFEANIPDDRQILTERLLLFSFAVVMMIRALLVGVQIWLHVWELGPVAAFLYMFSEGGLYGTVVAFALNKTIYDWRPKHSLTVILGWALGLGVSGVAAIYFNRGDLYHTIVILFDGLSIAAAIKWARPATSPFNMVIVVLGWALAWQAVNNVLGSQLWILFETEYVWAIVNALTVLLGLLFTVGLQVEKSREILKIAFLGALGFAVGNYIADMIRILFSLPGEISFALWGMIGGAVLEAPSRDSRRIFFVAAVCGIGLLVGAYIALDIFPATADQYANATFSDKATTLYQPFLGIGLGLALALLIRRTSATGVLVLLGVGVFLMTRALNAEFFPVSSIWESPVRGGLIGLVLGYGFGYTRMSKPPEVPLPLVRTKWVWIAIPGLLAIAIATLFLRSAPPPPVAYRWDFDHGTGGWANYHQLSVLQVNRGALILESYGLDPSFEAPTPLSISASDKPVITVRMRLSQGQGTIGQIFFTTNQDNNWDEKKSVVFTLRQDGIFRTYSVLMSENPAWQGIINRIRLDPINDPSQTKIKIAIDYIAVHAP